MKTLTLMRHAKSSWEEPLPDHKRPLNKRGKRAAKRIGLALKERKHALDRIVSSDAVRAKETAKRVAKEMDFPSRKLKLDSRLYEANVEEILEVIRSIEPKLSSVMIVGHNPGISETAVKLSGNDSFEWLPTGAVVVLRFDTNDWKKVGKSKGKLLFEIYPKELSGKSK